MARDLHFDLTLYPDPLLRRPALPVAAFDEELRAICLQVTIEGLRVAAQKRGMRFIVQDGLVKMLQGITTLREVLGGVD